MPNILEHNYNNHNYLVDLNKTSIKEVLSINTSTKPSVPVYLYKYIGVHSVYNKYNIDAFINHYLFASHPWNFNDPYDCSQELISFKNTKLNLILELNNDIIDRKEIETLYNSDDPLVKKELYEIMSKLLYYVLYMKIGIYSLTSKCNSMEMWSYYTNHRGIAIKLKLDLLPQNFAGPFPINYTSIFEELEYDKLKTSSMLYQSNIKADCWDHEDEWRLLFYGPDVMKIPYHNLPKAHNRIFYYSPKAIEEVILGFNFFEISEIDYDRSNQTNTYVKLKANKKTKRKILKTILDNQYKTLMVCLKNRTSSELIIKDIKIIKESSNRYHIKYIG